LGFAIQLHPITHFEFTILEGAIKACRSVVALRRLRLQITGIEAMPGFALFRNRIERRVRAANKLATIRTMRRVQRNSGGGGQSNAHAVPFIWP